jgi:AcrR family transcriptional regulator
MAEVKRHARSDLTRRDRARATRLRITKAAYALFCERGYSGTTMIDVADAAGVAVQTVYFTFHTKSELLSRAYDFAVLGDGDPTPPDGTAWYREMTDEPEVDVALRRVVEGIGEIMMRATPLDTIIRAAAGSDPETAAVRSFHERWRAQGYRAIIEVLATKSALRDGVSPVRATDLLLLYLGMDVYRVLVLDLGWQHQDWIDWTVATVGEQLFDVRLGLGAPQLTGDPPTNREVRSRPSDSA